MKLEITTDEATWLLRILNRIQIPLNSTDGAKDYTTGRSLWDKLVAKMKEEVDPLERQ